MANKLKPCPFCGSKSIALEKRNSGYQVRCCTCGARGKYIVVRAANPLASRQAAADAWNRRDGKTDGQD